MNTYYLTEKSYPASARFPPAHSPPVAGFAIAVVDSNDDIRTHTCHFLEKSGFHTWGLESAEDFYVGLLRKKADLVVVDLDLPGNHGLSLTKRLAAQRVPVIALTAHGDLESRIDALNAGALQSFARPADLRELTAGIRSILRHVPPGAHADAILFSSTSAPWRLDHTRACLIAPNRGTVPLTGRELALVNCLMSAIGDLVSKADLLEALDYDADAFHRIESQLTRLRRKTMQATGIPLPVRAVFGRGLVFAS